MTKPAMATRAPSVGRQVSQPTKKNWLSEIKTTVQARPTAAVLYGVPGIGKTSVGASIPGCVVMYNEGEDGITTLKSSGQVPSDCSQVGPMTTWQDGLDAIDSLLTGEHQLRCLVIDTFGGFERLCHTHVTATEFGGDAGPKGFLNFHKGYDVALPYWKLWLNKLDRLRDEKRMSILLLGHARVEDFSNPEGVDYNRWIPQCHVKTWEVTNQWADMVLFANYVVAVNEDGKAKGGQARFVYSQFHPAYSAKNRYNLPSQIPMGSSGQEAWNNIVNALQSVKEN